MATAVAAAMEMAAMVAGKVKGVATAMVAVDSVVRVATEMDEGAGGLRDQCISCSAGMYPLATTL